MLIGMHACVPMFYTHRLAQTCSGKLPCTLYHSLLVGLLADLGKVLLCPKQLLQTSWQVLAQRDHLLQHLKAGQASGAGSGDLLSAQEP